MRFTFFLLVFYLNIHIAKASSGEKTHRVLHSFGFCYSNNIYNKEAVNKQFGPLRQIPFYKYSYSFELNYSFVTKVGLGAEFGIAQGFIPLGFLTSFNEVFIDNTILKNGVVTTTDRIFTSLDIFYFDFPVRLIYDFKISKKMVLRLKTGASFKVYTRTGAAYTTNFGSEKNNNSYSVAFNNTESVDRYRYFYPDLTVGVDFLIQPKKPNHFLKIGLIYNHGFVPRAVGYYEYKYLGEEYDSKGTVQYGSTYLGISLGYQFMKYNAWKLSNAGKKMLFNPRF